MQAPIAPSCDDMMSTRHRATIQGYNIAVSQKKASGRLDVADSVPNMAITTASCSGAFPNEVRSDISPRRGRLV